MQLDRLLERCRLLEQRAGALYRSYAAGTRDDPALCALWTALAREEQEHAHSLTHAAARLDAAAGWQTRVDGWDKALGEVEARLAAAERLGPGATPDQQLAAALGLELSELDALRHMLLQVSGRPEPADVIAAHATRLAEDALRFSSDPQVRLQAELLRARARLRSAP